MLFSTTADEMIDLGEGQQFLVLQTLKRFFLKKPHQNNIQYINDKLSVQTQQVTSIVKLLN